MAALHPHQSSREAFKVINVGEINVSSRLVLSGGVGERRPLKLDAFNGAAITFNSIATQRSTTTNKVHAGVRATTRANVSYVCFFFFARPRKIQL